MKRYLILLIFMAFISCGNNENKIESEKNSAADLDRKYKEIGQRITEESFNTLRNKLMEAMASREISGAIEFCNIAAYPITDSLSKEFNAQIKRTTFKFRNPNNAPNDKEAAILEYFEKLHASGTQPKDSVITINDKQVWYIRPIFVQGICQNCHGNIGSTIAQNNYDVIKKLYPEDKAIDYKSGDFRGIWSVIINTDDKK